VDALLDQAVSNTQLMINESGASIIRSGMPELICDSVQIVQVFQNLISNAIKFRSEKAPEIRISAEKSDCAWVFSISDNGIGIPQDQQDRILKYSNVCNCMMNIPEPESDWRYARKS
jgi:light-regulated signal transduction histidine kinase (bacteriophytochrome)